MRTIALLLLLAGVVLAQDPFPATVERFRKAAAQTLEPGAQAKVHPAIEELVATKDVRAVKPLLEELVATYEREGIVLRSLKGIQKTGAEAIERATELGRELDFLRLKEKAGDASVGPEIQRLSEEQGEQERLFNEKREESVRVERTLIFVRELREKLLEGGVEVLRALEGDAVEAGLKSARQILDLANHEQALLLVRLLRSSGAKQAEAHLLDVLANPKTDGAVLRAAQYAVAPLMTRRGAELLLRVWERDPEGRGKHARHALSLAAGKRFADLAAARAWVEGLDG